MFAVTDKGMLRVLDLRSGALLWSNAVGQQPITAGYDDGRVFTTDRDGMTIAFDAASGLVLWSRGTNAESPPVADGGRVYAGGGAGLAVYDAATGALLREQQGRRGGSVMLTLDADKVYAATVCGGALAYHRNGPGIAWQGPDGGCTTGESSLPSALHAGHLFSPNPLNPSSDERHGHQRGDRGAAAAGAGRLPAAFAGGRGVFVEGGVVIARDVATDAEAWRFAEGEMLGSRR